MPSDLSHRPAPLVTVSGAAVAYIHTLFGFLAFGGALLLALYLHYHKVVKNGVAGWPQEYWPSVSATIGDWYPERNFFQVGIALMSGPRFLLVFLSSLLVSLSKPTSSHAKILLVVGSMRTIACGGWVYVTSSDDHDVHDFFMGLYLILTPPWMYITSGSLAPQPNKEANGATTAAPKASLADQARRTRRFAASAFFGMTPFMVLFFYRHKVLEIPGAYTHYAFFEWGLIIFDLLFDCASTYDLSRLEIHIVESRNPGGASGSRSSLEERPSILGGDWVRGGTRGALQSGAWSTAPAQQQQKSTANYAGDKSKTDSPLSLSDSTPGTRIPSLSEDLLNLLAESYIAYCFWSTLTALHPMIFFFSVYNMGVGGHEALLVIQVLALGLLVATPLGNKLFVSEGGKSNKGHTTHARRVSSSALAVLYCLGLTGLGIWTVEDRLVRLLTTAASCSSYAIVFALEWDQARQLGQSDRKAYTWLVGLIMSSVAKYANHGNNPAWPFLNSTNGGSNRLTFLLAVAATVVRLHHLRSRAKSTAVGLIERQQETSRTRSFFAAASLGSLIFLLHILMSDSGTMIAWTWTGYPLTGPMAIPHGRWIVLTSCLSTVAAVYKHSVARHPLVWIIGASSMLLLLLSEDWLGFLGALGIAAFLPLATPAILDVSTLGDPLKMSLIAWIVADLLAFLQVLTAAYAFVPGGKIMRERTPFMMALSMSLLLGGLFFSKRSAGSQVTNRSVPPRLQKLVALCLSALSTVAMLVPSYRMISPTDIQPYHPDSRVITVGIWTVHFALDQNMWDSTRRMSNLIHDLQLDVVGLLETDLHRTVFGNRDLTQYLAESLGMYADIGPGPDKHTWGAVLLSKFPIINTTHHLLPSPHGELAPAIHAVLDVYGVATHVLVSHNGQEEDPIDRELQTTKLAEIARHAYPHPFIFLGYVVTKPHAARPSPYEILFNDGRLLDVDPADLNRWCQYIGFRALERVGYVRVSRYTVTDTELQTAKFRMPPIGQGTVDPDRDVLPFRVRIVPQESWAYPTKFIDPPAMVYNKHKYSPHFYPLYYGSQPSQ